MATIINPKSVKSPHFNNFFEKVIKPTAPEVRIIQKDDSKFMKLLNFFIKIFNKDFMKSYTTTIGSDMYFPFEKLQVDDTGAVETLAHEWIHVMQKKKFSSFLFSFLYLFPQILGVLGLLGFLGFVFSPLFFLFFLLALFAPLPAYFRMKFEVEAFRVTVLFAKHYYGVTDMKFVEDWVTELMTGSAYYFAWPFKENVRKRILDEKALASTPEYDKIVDFIKTEMV